MEVYADGGGMQERDKILGGISSCRTPVIMDALLDARHCPRQAHEQFRAALE
jgi:hypothetical protein